MIAIYLYRIIFVFTFAPTNHSKSQSGTKIAVRLSGAFKLFFFRPQRYGYFPDYNQNEKIIKVI